MVADSDEPSRDEIRGIVSFQSMAIALMQGDVTGVADCLDNGVPLAQYNDDITSAISKLREIAVVLVMGRDNRLQGIVTAWDLAVEFTQLVDPFKRIGEIEERLRTLVGRRLEKVKEYLEQLTMGA